jgi:hypothetical protein
MSKARNLLDVHEEIEKEQVHYANKGRDWSDTPVDLTLQGTGGYSYNDNKMGVSGKYHPDGKRGAGYGSGNGESKYKS